MQIVNSPETFDVLVPDDREVWGVLLDGKRGVLLSTTKVPGMPHSVRKYACERQPKTVVIEFQ